ncbi:MAG: pyruvate kinase [Clostridia bacterium]|nr:pyruvate kinase [Clostridia bacterium]
MRRTKIVCTIGPASNNEETMAKMLEAGLNVARLNFSHGTHEEHKKTIEMFRKVRDKMEASAAVMLDTKGPEIRIRLFENGSVMLKEGDTFILTTEELTGNEERVSISYKDLPSQLHEGVRILLDDGKLSMIVKETNEKEIVCTVENGGELKNRKSINIPNFPLDMPYLSDADKADLLFGIENDVDFIAASFVRSRADVVALRKFLDYNGGHDIKIIAKIENMQGVADFDNILAAADGIMVARGDMGVEIDFEKLPGLQKRFIRQCYQAGKIVITATQMLESMISSRTPTRAEISDVANAVFDGTSAIMLSGETAMGIDPPNVVKVMSKIARQAENDAISLEAYAKYRYEVDHADTTNAICDAACTTARDLKAEAIIAVTKSGYTARLVSKFRPSQLIIATTPEEKVFHQLSMSWGVVPVLALEQGDAEKLFRHAIDCAKQIDAVKPGDTVVITGGIPLSVNGTTNTLKVETVDQRY